MGLSLLFCAGGCSTLVPYEEVVQSLPKERIIDVDGQKIYVEDTGSGRTLLMLHGFASSTYSFREIIPSLAKTHRVIAIDLNGFGYTERPDEWEQYQAEAQIHTIQRVLDHLDVRTCDVVAHSYGGALAILLAREDPTRVRLLALINPFTDFSETSPILQSPPVRAVAYAGSRVLLGSRPIFRSGVRKAYYQDHLVTRELAEEYRKRILIEGYRDSFHGFSFVMNGRGPIQFPLAEIKQPCLIIAGRHDELVPLESCETVADEMPRSTLHILEESGHSPAEEQPEDVIRLISTFVGD